MYQTHSTAPARIYSTKVPLFMGGFVLFGWVAIVGICVAMPMLVASQGPAFVVDSAAVDESGARPAATSGRRDLIAAVEGDPSDLAERLRAAGFVDDPNLTGRRRSRPFGARVAALRYDDDASGCAVILEGTTSTTVEFVEIEATFNEYAGAAEIVRVIGPTLAIVDPAIEPTMLIAAMHDGSGRIGAWSADRHPRDGGGVVVVLVNGAMPMARAD